ncbi:MAG: ORF6N domain-containing protein [Elusimicrobiota bacterium]
MKIAKINNLIYSVRSERVMLDRDLARLYEVETKTLNRAIRRNRERFPADFMFQLTREEWENLKYQFGASSWGGDRRALPHAFTEHGIAMLSSVLNSRRAVTVNIEIIRAFIRLRRALATERDRPARMKSAESAIAEHDRELTEHAVHFNQVFAEIRRLKKP